MIGKRGGILILQIFNMDQFPRKKRTTTKQQKKRTLKYLHKAFTPMKIKTTFVTQIVSLVFLNT